MGLTNLSTDSLSSMSSQILTTAAQQMQSGIQVGNTVPASSTMGIISSAAAPTLNALSDPNAVLPIQFPTSTPGVMHTVHVPLQSLQSALQSTGQTLTLPSGFLTESKVEIDDNSQVSRNIHFAILKYILLFISIFCYS